MECVTGTLQNMKRILQTVAIIKAFKAKKQHKTSVFERLVHPND